MRPEMCTLATVRHQPGADHVPKGVKRVEVGSHLPVDPWRATRAQLALGDGSARENDAGDRQLYVAGRVVSGWTYPASHYNQSG
jgi:hypothetical protein